MVIAFLPLIYNGIECCTNVINIIYYSLFSATQSSRTQEKWSSAGAYTNPAFDTHSEAKASPIFSQPSPSRTGQQQQSKKGICFCNDTTKKGLAVARNMLTAVEYADVSCSNVEKCYGGYEGRQKY